MDSIGSKTDKMGTTGTKHGWAYHEDNLYNNTETVRQACFQECLNTLEDYYNLIQINIK